MGYDNNNNKLQIYDLSLHPTDHGFRIVQHSADLLNVAIIQFSIKLLQLLRGYLEFEPATIQIQENKESQHLYSGIMIKQRNNLVL